MYKRIINPGLQYHRDVWVWTQNPFPFTNTTHNSNRSILRTDQRTDGSTDGPKSHRDIQTKNKKNRTERKTRIKKKYEKEKNGAEAN